VNDVSHLLTSEKAEDADEQEGICEGRLRTARTEFLLKAVKT